MARFITVAVDAPASGVGALIAHAAPLSPASVLLVAMIIIVVLGVNISAWLVVPKVIESACASPRPTGAGWEQPGRGRSGRGRDPDGEWASSTEWQSEAWSSSWDYAGSDTADGADDDWNVSDSRAQRHRESGAGAKDEHTAVPFGFSWGGDHPSAERDSAATISPDSSDGFSAASGGSTSSGPHRAEDRPAKP
ncbi:hypothetical protein [Parafrankia sp. EUN1f]|uniref:hypothetical protein n=1 Tax=Parafrankia sp. EUN1f TaxID=102897 RepID=UPI0001C45B79|nr:hypothetical protein [Parafrankia sp. EUN1f]EFC81636.1 hypothetical protein FrEUN1fDRAFT_5235 [Parafrankia sp. EUN1f]